MRAGLSTIQQTLTPEAASVLNHSIEEAGRRNHGQTTPLHVAATLLASPSGYLRQACIRSHPNSSHPLQCRALELCFSVALERLPSATAQNMSEPPISNALMAALKRAQAHQRRGCPEQQQQPLLAVKVELEQLIISILDDPSVSRVMREASFSSPAVKATIEQSLNSSNSSSHHQMIPGGNVTLAGTFGGIGPRMMLSSPAPIPVGPGANRNMYVNPKLKQGGVSSGNTRNEEVNKVVDILMRTKKRNPVVVGENEPEAVVKELLRRIEKGQLGPLKNVQVISIENELVCDKNQIVGKIKELGGLIETRINGNGDGDGGGGIIVDLGDLKWLVEQQQVVSETGKAAVAEMGRLLTRFPSKIWLIGTATCETYLRCQVYHSSMENDWDLQAVPIASRSPMPGIFPRLGPDRVLGNSIEPLNPLKSFPSMMPPLIRRIPENVDPSRRTSCCPQCLEKYEEELKFMSKEFENVSSENKSEAARPALPQWLQNAKLQSSEVNATNQPQGKNLELVIKQKTQELQGKWNDACLRLHPNFHQNVSANRVAPPYLGPMSLYNPKLLAHQPLKPKLQVTSKFGEALQSNTHQVTIQPSLSPVSPPASLVRTDLALGCKVSETSPEKTNETQEDRVKDLLGCMYSESQTKFLEKFANALDADTFKKLLKGLMERAWWQSEAASAVASAVTKCRLGNGKRRGSGSKGDIWLLFTGPDRIGKRKMASVLSEQICGTNPVVISLGSRRDDAEPDTNIRGKTALNRIAEAVRRNPFSVIMLEDIDEADMLLRGSIRRAIERGRLTDSHGREISLGNVIFILTGNWSSVGNGHLADEKRLAAAAGGNWQLKLTMSEKNAKRRATWLTDEPRQTKPRKDSNSGFSFDLNLAADNEEDRTDGSHNSSDLTIDHDQEELGLDTIRQFSITSVPQELVSSVDETIVFKPVDFPFVRREIKKTISTKFSVVLEDRFSIQVQEDVVEKIIGGLWHSRSSLEEWVENALAPSFEQLKSRLPSSSDENTAVQLRLEVNPSLDIRSTANWLPSEVEVMVEGA